MDEYSFCKEISDEFKVIELDSKTLIYRIDGFIYACNMDLSNSICTKNISSTRLPYINKSLASENLNYNINFMRCYDSKEGPGFAIIGKYNNLKLFFSNYYDSDKNKDRVNEIPFHITLEQVHDNINYQIDIETIANSHTRFVIKKNKNEDIFPSTVIFNANITDFGKILKLVKSFVHNPEVVFVIYDEIINRKEVVLTDKEFNIPLAKDERLDKPMNKTQKILKKLINND